jgi:hypothetical protein
MSFAVPAVTVDDLDIRLSIVIGSERVACISGGGALMGVAGAGAVEGRKREYNVGRFSGKGSTIVRTEGDRDRWPGASGDGEMEGTRVVSDTIVAWETALTDRLWARRPLNQARSGSVSSGVLLTDLKCFDIMIAPRPPGEPKGPSFLASSLS